MQLNYKKLKSYRLWFFNNYIVTFHSWFESLTKGFYQKEGKLCRIE